MGPIDPESSVEEGLNPFRPTGDTSCTKGQKVPDPFTAAKRAGRQCPHTSRSDSAKYYTVFTNIAAQFRHTTTGTWWGVFRAFVTWLSSVALSLADVWHVVNSHAHLLRRIYRHICTIPARSTPMVRHTYLQGRYSYTAYFTLTAGALRN